MTNKWTETNASDWSENWEPKEDELPPPKLTESMRRKISDYIYYYPLRPWGTCTAGLKRSDKYCLILGYMRY